MKILIIFPKRGGKISNAMIWNGKKGTKLTSLGGTNSKAEGLARQSKVTIDSYDVIYELLENVTSAVIKMFTPELEKHALGKAKVLAIFMTNKGEMIIGGRVEEGFLKKQLKEGLWNQGADFPKRQKYNLASW